MDSERRKTRKMHPRQDANIFSKIMFWYTRDLFKKGLKTAIEEHDLYDVLPECDTSTIGDRIESEWNSLKNKKFPLILVFWNMFGKYYILVGLIKLIITIILNIARPILLSRLTFYFTPDQKELTKSQAYLYSLLLIVISAVDVMYRQNYFLTVEVLAIKVRVAIASLIYRKLLKLPTSQLRHVSFGKIANLITRDVNAFEQFFYVFNQVLIGIITMTIICYIIYQKLGLAVLVVVGAFGIFIPFQVVIGVWIGSLKSNTSIKTDIRIGILQEALFNIRSAKMYVWEKYLNRIIATARKEEMNILLRMVNVLFFTIVTAILIYNVTFYLVLMTHIWSGKSLSAELIYFVTSGMLEIGRNLTIFIPNGVSHLSQIIVAITRMQVVIQNLEVSIPIAHEAVDTKKPRIQFRDVTIATPDKTILENVTLDIDGGLTLITGPAGSGKSIFLMTVLREFTPSQGTLVTEGSVSYASQEPWLFPSTIKQNILFGSAYNKKRYQEVIEACALQYDLDLLEKGDSTIISDRGINLSKGQQSRVNLARAIYRKSDIYLLDDCLCCLDPLVADSIFTNCILKFLKDKLVILVSNNSNLQSYACNILILNERTINVSQNKSPLVVQTNTEMVICDNKNIDCGKSNTEDDDTSVISRLLDQRGIEEKVYEEENKVGSVSLRTYKTYIKLGGGRLFCVIILSTFVLTQLSLSYRDKLVSEWANLEEELLTSNSSASDFKHIALEEKRTIILYKFTAAIVVISLMTLVRGCVLFLFAKNVSINLHKKMLNSVLKTSMKFFDHTFIGNIVNRFSKDLVNVDENIPTFLLQFTAIIFETAGNILLISSTSLRFIIPILLLFSIVIVLRYIYIKTGQPLKRLEASTKSPVIGYLNSTFEGLTSIKVFRAERVVNDEFERLHNIYNSAAFSYLSCTIAFDFAVDIFALIFTAVVILQFVIFDNGVLPGDVGLATTQASIIGGILFYAILKCAQLETQMTSVERASDYMDLESERKTGLKIKDWPENAEIRYEHVYLSINSHYSKTYLLKNVNFLIKSSKKIGIVGRTGAGKSSIVSALFRLYEIEGKITIDGIDIKTLSLDYLRSKISVIPQDPMLLNGTLRDNIDPGKKLPDDELWKAIETVQLNQFVRSLDVHIEDLNFTYGQKKLICLARVLIKNSKILILDEIIENLDHETEDLICNIIDKEFASCTVIKIAHKLKFVRRCDTILVVDNGKIVECDSPDNLLNNKNGLFYKMSQTRAFGLDSNEDLNNE